jgi:hypothetical protein
MLAWPRDEGVMERNSRGDVDFHYGLYFKRGSANNQLNVNGTERQGDSGQAGSTGNSGHRYRGRFGY